MRRRSKRRNDIYRDNKKKLNISILREVSLWILTTALALFLAGFFVHFFGYRTSVIGASMEDSLAGGQEVLVDRLMFKVADLKKGDIIAFYPGGNTSAHPYVKRIVGTPGDVVQILDGILLVNGVAEAGSDLNNRMEYAGIAESPIALQEDEYFVLGDNRNNSEDSRSAGLGPIDRKMIIGRAWLALPVPGEGFSFVK